VLLNQFSIFLELFAKQKEAKSKKGRPGRTGRTMPEIPIPKEMHPRRKKRILFIFFMVVTLPSL